MKGLYLLINIVAVLIPFVASFGPKIQFWKKWKFLVPSILLSMLVFIPWDVAFTHQGIWGFNANYLIGIYLFNLPIEEFLFFITIPYACVFSYEVVRYFLEKQLTNSWPIYVSTLLSLALLTSGLIFINNTYTSVTFISTALFILFHQFIIKSSYLGFFYLTYAICLIPFLLVNGVLTGSMIEEPIVWYNNQYNLGFRIFTIPVEDIFYGLTLILLNLTFYEYLQKRHVSYKD